MLIVRGTVEEQPKIGVWRRSSPVQCEKNERLGEKKQNQEGEGESGAIKRIKTLDDRNSTEYSRGRADHVP